MDAMLLYNSRQNWQKWTGPEKFHNCFCVHFDRCSKSFTFGSETGFQALSLPNLETFLPFPNILRFRVLNRLVIYETTHTKCFLYQISCTALFVSNRACAKSLQSFKICPEVVLLFFKFYQVFTGLKMLYFRCQQEYGLKRHIALDSSIYFRCTCHPRKCDICGHFISLTLQRNIPYAFLVWLITIFVTLKIIIFLL